MLAHDPVAESGLHSVDFFAWLPVGVASTKTGQSPVSLILTRPQANATAKAKANVVPHGDGSAPDLNRSGSLGMSLGGFKGG